MLDRLVLADRPPEHGALLRIGRRAPQRRAAEPDRFGADQDALRIEAVENIFETAAFLADAVLHRDFQAVDEHLIGIDRLPSHLLDLAHLDEAAVERGEEQRQAIGRPAPALDRRAAGQDQHLVGDLRCGDPDFRAGDDITVAAAFGASLQLGGFQAGIRFRHCKARLLLAGDDRRQHAPLLFFAAVNHDRIEPEDVHVHRRGAGKSGARRRDGLHHHRGLGDAEARAAEGFRNADAKPAIPRQRAMKFVRKLTVEIAREPIIIAKARANLLDRRAHRLLQVCEREVDWGYSAVGMSMASVTRMEHQ